MKKTTVNKRLLFLTLHLLCILLGTTVAQGPFSASKPNDDDIEVIPIGLIGINGKRIIAEATIEGIEGYVVIDPGIHKVLLNQEYFSGRLCDHEIIGAANQARELRSARVKIQLGNITRVVRHAHIADLSLINQIGPSILGLIGWDIFSNREIEIDYVARTLTVLTLDEFGERVVGDDRSAAIISLPFRLRRSLLCIPMQMKEHQLEMVLDPGAEGNLLRERVLKKYAIPVNTLGDAMVHGTCGTKRAPRVKLIGVCLGSVEVGELNVYLMPLPQSLSADGVLGYDFLKDYITSINFVKQEVSFYEYRKSDVQVASSTRQPLRISQAGVLPKGAVAKY